MSDNTDLDIDRFFATAGYGILAVITFATCFILTWVIITSTLEVTGEIWTGNKLAVIVPWALLLAISFFAIVIPVAAFEDSLESRRDDLPSAMVFGSVGGFLAIGIALLAAASGILDVELLSAIAPNTPAEDPTGSFLTILPLAISIFYCYEIDKMDTDDDTGLDPEYVRENRERMDPERELGALIHEDSQSGSNQPQNSDAQTTDNSSGDKSGGEDDTETKDDLTYDWQSDTGVSLNDVGGMEDLKDELRREVIGPLVTDRERAEALDIPAPNLLFYGPPGTGKTFIAKALATELDLPFARLSGADVQSKWINESSGRIKTLFEEAQKLAEREGGAVVFFDELDAVLPNRTGQSHEENRKVVNEFLAHLQETTDHNVVFIGATNRRDDLDPAATRRGRIDREIQIGLPDREGRIAILETQLRDRDHHLTDEEIAATATSTEGFSAADLEGLVLDAARNAAFGRNDDTITINDIKEAYDRHH